MTSAAPSKLYSDDVSLVVVLLDTNPFFWSSAAASSLPFSKFLNQVIPFLNSLLLLNQFNQVVLIATGTASCGYIYDSSSAASPGDVTAVCTQILRKLEELPIRDHEKRTAGDKPAAATISSLLSGSLSLALCYIQRVFRTGAIHPQPRGSPDGPEQHVFCILFASNVKHYILLLQI